LRSDYVARYRDTCQEVEAEFARNVALYPGRIQCRRGCSQCCHQLFQITEIEAAVISRAMKTMPEGERADLQARALAYLPEREAIVKRHGMVEAWGKLPPEGTRLACPALGEDGACRIYEHRPLICRKFGMPLHNPQKPGQVFACELNFAAGEEIADDRLVQIQTGIYERWKGVQQDYNRAGGRRDERPVTVARALLEDFDDEARR
jgi:Fe-S-cluster containining protein